MTLTLVTPPDGEPVVPAEAVTHLRLPDDHPDDAWLDTCIQAAREHVETSTNRALLTQTWRLTLDGFPRCGPIRLPRPPLQEVISVKYLDEAGAEQTLAPAAYVVDAVSVPGRLVPAYGTTWPTIRHTVNAVWIDYKAGYGDQTKVPRALKAAMLLLLGDLYENREAQVVGTTIAENPTVDRLVWPYRVIEAF